MKIADTFPDGQKRLWTVGECLGRGLWGRSFLVRDADGHERVLKVALTAADFPTDVPLRADVPDLCAAALDEQARLLLRGDLPFLTRLEERVTLPDGRSGLLLPRFQATLGRKLEAGAPLTAVLLVVQRVAEQLARAGVVHGNLRPSNIFVADRGVPVLADVMTPSAARLLTRVETSSAPRGRWRPGEAADRPVATWDTWALCQTLWQAAMLRDTTPGAAHRLESPCEGLDKVALASLKDRVLARLGVEGTNPRFRSRLADRLAAVLNRGLSRAAEPSPPYRFVDAPALLGRLEEVTALLAPRVGEVGRVLLANGADTRGTFQGSDGISFAVSVGCTPGVADHDDVVCGLQLVDVDAPEPTNRVSVADAKFRVTTHPSGRMRFQFDLPRVAPGRYRVRVAFTVKDSGQEPQVAEGRFEVRPPPGYVPPVAQDEVRGTMITLDRARRGPSTEPSSPSAATDLEPDDDTMSTEPTELASDPGAEIIEGLFPRPIAPPDADLDEPGHLVTARVEFEETEANIAMSGGGVLGTDPGFGQDPVRALPGPHPETSIPSITAFATGYGAPISPTAPVVRPAFGLPRPSLAVPRPAIAPHGAPGMGSDPAGHRVATRPEPAFGSSDRPSLGAESHPGRDRDLDSDWSEGPDDWSAMPGDEMDLGIDHDALSHLAGDDLPSWRRTELPFDTRSFPVLHRLVERVQRDSTAALVAVVVGCSLLLLGCMALLKSC